MKISSKKIFYLALAAICLVSIGGAIVYYFYALNWPGIILSLILAGGGFWFFIHVLFEQKKDSLGADVITKKFIAPKTKIDWKKIAVSFVWLLPYFLLFALCSLLLVKARTDTALTSPWQVVSAKFFIAYLLATGYLFWLILKNSRFTLWLIIAHYFLSFSVLWIVFRIGYGYDPFIHQATVALIDKQGAVDPKPFYYLSQYSLVIIAHKFLFIPIVWLDKLLVPVLAAFTLPPTIFLFLKKNSLSSIYSLLSILCLIILPFSIFTLTVPQNLAYLFLILAIFFALAAAEQAEKILSYLLAFTAMVMHPLAGIPALLFVIAISIYRAPIKIKGIFYALIFILNAAALPILFWLTQKNNYSGDVATADSNLGWPAIIWPQRENIILNFIYFFQSNLWLILILISAAAFYAVYRYRQKYPALIFPANFSLTLLLAYFITRQINFNFLISYERADYANRILTVAFIFLLPIIAILFYKFINRILESNPWLKYSWLVFLLLLIAVSLFGSYPRRDNYFNSHGFAVGKNDLEAVNWIEKDARGAPYAVLANQQVSVGALWTFGFNRYYKILPPPPAPPLAGGEIYFYPIPTGGLLYQIYLDMVYKKADKATALKAADLTGAKIIYFVLNKYWTGFDKIVEQAKIGAVSYENLNNGEIYIFKYTK